MLFHSDCEVLIRLQIFVPKIFAVVLAIKEAIVQPMLAKLWTPWKQSQHCHEDDKHAEKYNMFNTMLQDNTFYEL